MIMKSVCDFFRKLFSKKEKPSQEVKEVKCEQPQVEEKPKVEKTVEPKPAPAKKKKRGRPRKKKKEE